MTEPENVAFPAVMVQSAESSARRKASVAPLRLIDGKLDVVPPSWSLAKSVSAEFSAVITPDDGLLSVDNPEVPT